MHLRKKTLEKLRMIINGDDTPDYRSGPRLVAFFNELGFHDGYGQGFPSRWAYTDDKLEQINGKPELDLCIKNTFAVIDFIDRIEELDLIITDFNRYMAFDKWKVVRDNDIISISKLDKVVVETTSENVSEIYEDEFLKSTLDADIDTLGLDPNMTSVIKSRLAEAEKCIRNEAPLASIILLGSINRRYIVRHSINVPKAIQ